MSVSKESILFPLSGNVVNLRKSIQNFYDFANVFEIVGVVGDADPYEFLQNCYSECRENLVCHKAISSRLFLSWRHCLVRDDFPTARGDGAERQREPPPSATVECSEAEGQSESLPALGCSLRRGGGKRDLSTG